MIDVIGGRLPFALNLGGWAGSRFPFSEGAADIVISGATTWSDAAGFKRVGKLTINAGQTLTIARSPFWIFADEINFGDTASQIFGGGPAGASSGTFSAAYARGATYVSTGRAQGGCGGIILFVVCRTITGAAGKIVADGGNGYRDTTAAAATGGRGGQGAFSRNFDVSSANNEDWGGANGLGVVGDNPPLLIALLLGSGGSIGNGGGVAGGSGSGSGASAGGAGGSGIGGGGTASTLIIAAGTSLVPPSPQQLMMLASMGCLGGGGGGAYCEIAVGTNNGSGGGGGGSVVVWVSDLAVTPTLTATGGSGTGNGSAGAAGVTHLIDLAA